MNCRAAGSFRSRWTCGARCGGREAPLRRCAPCPQGDDALAAGQPLLGVAGIGPASFDGAGYPQSVVDQMPENRAQ
ncbi:hypothetical protein DBR23_07360 [Acidovorax sp. HMWF018]|nr:hypothetical protein DBR23_07360 [Acidovorax sp. HMWF018]